MSLKNRKAGKLKDLELNKIVFIVECLKEKVKNNEPVTEEDKKEVLQEIESSINVIMSYNGAE